MHLPPVRDLLWRARYLVEPVRYALCRGRQRLHEELECARHLRDHFIEELRLLRALPGQVRALQQQRDEDAQLLEIQRERLDEKTAALRRLEQTAQEQAPFLEYLRADVEAEDVRLRIIQSRAEGATVPSVCESPDWKEAWAQRNEKLRTAVQRLQEFRRRGDLPPGGLRSIGGRT